MSSFAGTSETFFTAISAVVFTDFYIPFSDDFFGGRALKTLIFNSEETGRFFVDFLGITWQLFDLSTGCSTTPKSDQYGAYKLTFSAAFDHINKEDNSVNLSNSLNSDSNYISLSNNAVFGDTDFKKPYATSLNLNLYDSGSLINPYSLPLINTFLLLTSGAFLT